MAIKTVIDVNTYEQSSDRSPFLKTTGSIKFKINCERVCEPLIDIDFGRGEVSLKLADIKNIINALSLIKGLPPLDPLD